MGQLSFFNSENEATKIKMLPYSIMPNLPRSVNIPRHIIKVLKSGFTPRSVGVWAELKSLYKTGSFFCARGKGLRFTYEDENGKLKAYFVFEKYHTNSHIQFYGKTASETGYRSNFVATGLSLDESIEQMPKFVMEWHTQLLGFDKKKPRKTKKNAK